MTNKLHLQKGLNRDTISLTGVEADTGRGEASLPVTCKMFLGLGFNSFYSLTRSFRGRGDHPSTHLQAILPPTPIPPSFPAQSMYPPPLQAYPPPYSSGPGLVPPPPVNYQPQAVYVSGPGVLNPPWVAPGAQPPLVSLPGSLSQPPLSKDDFYRQRHHRQDK